MGDDGRVEAQSSGIRFDAAEQRVGSGRRVGSLEVDAVGLWLNIFEKLVTKKFHSAPLNGIEFFLIDMSEITFLYLILL